MRRAPGIGRLLGALRRWWVPLSLALGVRLLYWVLVTPDWRPDADADQYVRLGRSLARGDGFTLIFPQLEPHATAFRPPLYPALLAPGNLVFGDALWPARLLSVLLGLLVVLLTAVLAARVAGRVAGLVAGAAVAVYPPLVANDTVTLTEPLALALLLGAVLLIDERRWFPAGLALGALLLTRPNGYLVVAILALWAGSRLGWRRGAAVAAVAAVVLMPWLVRNKVQVGTWRPTTSDGFTMAAMWGLPAQDAGGFVDPVFSPAYDDLDHRLSQFEEAEWNEKLTTEATEALKNNPGYLVTLVPDNFAGFFEIAPDQNRYPERNDGRNWDYRQATLPAFYLVTLLGLVGLFGYWRDDRVQIVVLLVAQFVFLSLLLVAPPRLRAPFDLLMCIGVGLLAATLWSRWFPERRDPNAGQPGTAIRPATDDVRH